MGRPPKFERQQAIVAARDLFWAQGFQHTTVSELIIAMGIQRSSFYNSFKSRESVFREAIFDYKSITPDRALLNVRNGDAIGAAFTVFFKALCKFVITNGKGRGCFASNMLSEMGNRSDDTALLIKQLFKAQLVNYNRLIHIAVEQGELSEDTQSGALALEIAMFQVGMNTHSKLHNNEETLWACARLFLKQNGLLDEQNTLH
ncbi:MAG: TetR/AcrR family transcriptional regulator [Cohaesibacteraceae bacterium]|nr:TetR/AcrR family transcriptional regulator [Cohaesibacteraceae bacterium]